MDIAEVQTAQGRLHLSVGIDRSSNFAFAPRVDRATTATARAVLDALVAAIPYGIEIVLTDNGSQFADLRKNRPVRPPCWAGIRFTGPFRRMASTTG